MHANILAMASLRAPPHLNTNMQISYIVPGTLLLAGLAGSENLKAALRAQNFCLSPLQGTDQIPPHGMEQVALTTWPSHCVDLELTKPVCETVYPVLLHFYPIFPRAGSDCGPLPEHETELRKAIKTDIIGLVDKNLGVFEGDTTAIYQYWHGTDEDAFLEALRWIMRFYPTVIERGPQLRDLLFYHLVKDEILDNLPMIAEYLSASQRLPEKFLPQELRERLATLAPASVATILLNIGDGGDPNYTTKLSIVLRQTEVAPELAKVLLDGGGIDTEQFLGQFQELLETKGATEEDRLRQLLTVLLEKGDFDYAMELFFSGLDTFEGTREDRSRMEALLCRRPLIARDLAEAFARDTPALGAVREWPANLCTEQASLEDCMKQMTQVALETQGEAGL